MNTEINSKSLAKELKEAKEGFDFAAFGTKAVNALANSEADLAAKQKELDKANADASSAIEQMVELSKQLDLQQSNGNGAIIVKVKGKNKKIVGDRFSLPKFGTMNAKELSQNKDALEFLYERKSGALVDAE